MIVHYKKYVQKLNDALWSVDTGSLQKAADLIADTAANGRTIFVCGNGGSAAIADHLTCDCLKGIRSDTHIRPRVVSLCSNGPLLTAIANDMSYDRVFSYQLESLMRKGDILITISSSGNSPNIISAIEAAQDMKNKVISFCGFAGGGSLKADIPVHVKSDNYGVVEDIHQSLMHIIAQHIRLTCAVPGAELKL